MHFTSYNLEGLEREFHDAKNRVLSDENLSSRERQAQLRQIQDEYHYTRAILEGSATRSEAGSSGSSSGSSAGHEQSQLNRIFARRRRRHWK